MGSLRLYNKDGDYITEMYSNAAVKFNQIVYLGGDMFMANIYLRVGSDPYVYYIDILNMRRKGNEMIPVEILAGLDGGIYSNKGLAFDGRRLYKIVQISLLPPQRYFIVYDLDGKMMYNKGYGFVGYSCICSDGKGLYGIDNSTTPDSLIQFNIDGQTVYKTNSTSITGGAGTYRDSFFDGKHIWLRDSNNIHVCRPDGTIVKSMFIRNVTAGNTALCSDGKDLIFGF